MWKLWESSSSWYFLCYNQNTWHSQLMGGHLWLHYGYLWFQTFLTIVCGGCGRAEQVAENSSCWVARKERKGYPDIQLAFSSLLFYSLWSLIPGNVTTGFLVSLFPQSIVYEDNFSDILRIWHFNLLTILNLINLAVIINTPAFAANMIKSFTIPG